MKSRKLVYIMVLLVCIMLGYYSTEVYGDDTISGKCGDNLTWKIANGILTISGTGAMYDYTYSYETIREDGKTYDTTAPWTIYQNSLTGVVFEEGITYIGEYAFGWSLVPFGVLEIPESVVCIGTGAFRNCDGIEKVIFPEGLENIEGYAFTNCSNLTFDNLPETLTSMGWNAFAFCTNLKEITIPESIIDIPVQCFWGCINLEEVYLHENLRTLEGGAFRECKSLKKIELPVRLEDMGDVTFYHCTSLEEVVIPDGIAIEWIGPNGFNSTKLKKIKIPEGITRLCGNAFHGCTMLEEIILPKTLKEIHSGALSGCYSLEKLTIPSSVEEICEWVFNGAGLKEIRFEGEVPRDVDSYASSADELYEDRAAGEDLLYLEDLPDGTTIYYPITCSSWESVINVEEHQRFNWQPYTLSALATDIVDIVERYTTSKECDMVLEIANNSNLTAEEKVYKLYEHYNYSDITDVRDRVEYLSDTYWERHSYEGLLADDMYHSWQWYNYLNNTTKGKVARASLVLSGLAFNGELGTWLDPGTYLDGEYPGVEKYKSLLEEFINRQKEEMEFHAYIKETEKFINSTTGLFSAVEKGEILKELGKTKNTVAAQSVFNKFVYSKISLFDGTTIEMNYEEKTPFMTAMKDVDTAFKIVNITMDGINGFIDISSNLQLYEIYTEFLLDIYSDYDLPKEMRMAAYVLNEELENGYGAVVEDILQAIRDECLDNALDAAGVSKVLGLNGWASAISFTSFCMNQFVDIGKLVVNSAHTEGYAMLAMHFKTKLEQSANDFLENKTEENAWKFYENYVMLWKLRVAGEEKYLQMNNLEADELVTNAANKLEVKPLNEFISEACSYEDKKASVERMLRTLQGFQFAYSFEEGIVVKEEIYVDKIIVACPVDVEILTSSGETVCILEDGEEYEFSNSYGEFISVYNAISGDYIKIAYFNDTDAYRVRIIGRNEGKVTYTYVHTDDHLSCEVTGFDAIVVSEDMIIDVVTNEETYDVDVDGDDIIDITAQQVNKNKISLQFDCLNGKEIYVSYIDDMGNYTKPADPMLEKHIFDGWYTELQGKGESLENITEITKTTTFYANWRPILFSIALNNGYLQDGSVCGNFEEGTNITIIANEPEEGMEFAGWEITSGQVSLPASGSALQLSFSMPPSDLVLTASYKTLTTQEPTVTPEPTITPETVTPEPTVIPEPTVAPRPTVTPEPTVTLKPTVTPKPTPAPKPTERPWPVVTPKPTTVPITTPEVELTATPTLTPVPTEAVVENKIWFRNQNGELVKSAVLYVGETMKLYPENAIQVTEVTWFSTNPEVATISSEGEITVHSAGLAEIYWILDDIQSERFIVVAEPKPEFVNRETEAIREILLGTSKMDTVPVRFMEPGQEIDLNFYGVKQWKKERYEYEWISSDEAVAVVDKVGKVTVKAHGIATIELKLKNKETGELLNVKSVVLLVPESKEKILLGTSKENVFTSYTLQRGNKIDLNFYGVKNWKQGDYTYQWTSSDTSVAWVDSKGNVVGVSQGEAIITLSLINKKTGFPLWVTPVEIEVSEKK